MSLNTYFFNTAVYTIVVFFKTTQCDWRVRPKSDFILIQMSLILNNRIILTLSRDVTKYLEVYCDLQITVACLSQLYVIRKVNTKIVYFINKNHINLKCFLSSKFLICTIDFLCVFPIIGCMNLYILLIGITACSILLKLEVSFISRKLSKTYQIKICN